MLEAALRRERTIVAAGLAAVAAIAWAAVLRMAGPMPAGTPAGMTMPGMAGAGTMPLGWLVLMWGVMMVAMMTPSAAPAILLFAGVVRRRRAQGVPAAPVMAFTAGYLLVWSGYAAIAGTAQWFLHRAALLSPAMTAATPALAGSLLVAAGLYQWLPFKTACLQRCRSPLGIFAATWREGRWGALRMGAEHGTSCVGCCWLLMALLFVMGVMNLLWVAVLAGLVLAEKVLPSGERAGRLAGAGLVVWGIWTLSAGAVAH